MRNVMTIFRRDLAAYFTSPIGYIFMIVFVTAGRNTQNKMGKFAKKGRMSATRNMKKEVMNRPTLIVTKTIMKI